MSLYSETRAARFLSSERWGRDGPADAWDLGDVETPPYALLVGVVGRFIWSGRVLYWFGIGIWTSEPALEYDEGERARREYGVRYMADGVKLRATRLCGPDDPPSHHHGPPVVPQTHRREGRVPACLLQARRTSGRRIWAMVAG